MMRYAEKGEGKFVKMMELCLGAAVSDPPAPTDQDVSVAAAGGELLAVVGFEAGPGHPPNHISVTSLSTNHMMACV